MADTEWLYDADTGEYFTADQLDPSSYQVVGPTEDRSVDIQPEEAGWWDTISSTPRRAELGLRQSLGGGIRFAENLFGGDGSFGEAISDKARSDLQGMQEELQLQPGSVKSLTSEGITGALQFLPYLAGTAVAGPALPIAGLTAQMFGSNYDNQREKGNTFGKSALTAGGQAIFDGAVEFSNVGRFLKPGTSILRKMAEGAISEGLENPIQGLGDLAVDYFVNDTVPTAEDGRNLIRSIPTGMIAGGILGGVGHGIEAGQRASTENSVDALSKTFDLQNATAPEAAPPSAQSEIATLPDSMFGDTTEIAPEPPPLDYGQEDIALPTQAPVQQMSDPLETKLVTDPATRAKIDATVLSGDKAIVDDSVAVGPATYIEQLEQAAKAEGRSVVRTVLPRGYGHSVISPVALPLKEIGAIPSLFQHRADSDPITGETSDRKIRGEWDDSLAGTVVVFEPKNPNSFTDKSGKSYSLKNGEKFAIVNGHNRKAGADSAGADFLNSEILREADGWTIDEAKSHGAELNIAQGNVAPEDIAKFYHDTARSKGEAFAAKRARTLGISEGSTISRANRQGFAIGIDASDSTYSAFQAKQITADQAYILAEQLGSYPRLQDALLKSAMNGTSPESLRRKAQAKWAVAEGFSTGEQGPMFVDPIPPEIHEAAFEQILERRAEDLKDEANSLGSARSAERANASGKIQVLDAEGGLVRLKEIAAEKAALRDWVNHPELKKAIQAEEAILAPILNAQAIEQAKGKPLQQDLIAKTGQGRRKSGLEQAKEITGIGRKRVLSGESGIGDFLFGGGKAVDEGLSPEGMAKVEKALGLVTEDQWTDSEKLLRGDSFLAKYVPGLKGTQEAYRKAFLYPRTLAKKFKNFEPYYLAAHKKFRNRDTVGMEMRETVGPLLDLTEEENSKVSALMAMVRIRAKSGQTYSEEPAALKQLGLSDREVLGYRSWVEARERALGVIEDTLASTPPASVHNEAQLENWRLKVGQAVQEMRAEAFVPFSRFGKHYVEVRPSKEMPSGHFSLHETAREAAKVAGQWRKKGASSHIGELLTPPTEGFESMSPDFAKVLQTLDGDVKEQFGRPLPINSFPKHFKEARLTPGFNPDMRQNIAEYLSGLAGWSANRKLRHEFEQIDASKGVDATKDPALYDYKEKYKKYVTTNSSELSDLRKFLAYWYLSRPLTAMVNLTQSFTTTIPELMDHMSVPAAYAEGAKVMKTTLSYMANPEGMGDKELASALRIALKDGSIAEEATRELSMRAKGVKDGQSWGDYAMWLFAQTEKFNRTYAFIAGYRVARNKGMVGAAAQSFAENFVQTTQYDYTKANRPEIARGKKSALMVFRNFQGSWLRQLRNGWEQDGFKSAKMYSMLGHMAVLGGAGALPFARELMKALEAAGHDPRLTVRKAFDQMGAGAAADVFLNGLPTMFGLNISGNISFGELAPQIEQGFLGSLARLTLGVVADPVQRIGRAYNLATEFDNPRGAAEQLMPPALRALSETQKAASKGYFEDQRTMPLVENPTIGELAVKAIGGTPPRLGKEYELRHSEDLATARERDNDNINFKLAKAKFEQDAERYRELIVEARTNGININYPSVNKFLKEFASRRNASVKKAPKSARDDIRDIQRVYGP